jgi:hypothetical protein
VDRPTTIVGAVRTLCSHPDALQSTNLSISRANGFARYSARVHTDVLAATSGIDWNQVFAVKFLGIALGVLILLWAIRRMFGGKR